MKTEIKTAIVLGIVIVAVVAGLSGVFSSIETSQTLQLDETVQDQTIQNIDKSRFKKAPSLTGIAGYINTSPEKLEDELRFVLITSQAKVVRGNCGTSTEMEGLSLEIVSSQAEKCDRCWHRREDVELKNSW